MKNDTIQLDIGILSKYRLKDILSEQIVWIRFLGQMTMPKRKAVRKENILILVLGNEWTVMKYVSFM